MSLAPGGGGVLPLPLRQVGAIDRAGGHLDDHLSAPWYGVGNLRPRQHFRSSILGNRDCVHTDNARTCFKSLLPHSYWLIAAIWAVAGYAPRDYRSG